MSRPIRGISEQLARMLAEVRPVQPIDVPLSEALGSVLAEDVHTPWSLPPFDRAGVDGFAVVAADTALAQVGRPARLLVVDDVAPGRPGRVPVTPGTCAMVARGCPIPPGADAVVPIESVAGSTPTALVQQAVPRGWQIQVTGSEVAAGGVVVDSGTTVGPATLGLAAAAGRGRLLVHPSPRVVVIVVGQELVSAGRPPRVGTVSDQTGPLVAAQFSAVGARCARLGPLPDDPRVIADAVSDQLTSADLIVTTGGSGQGGHDTLAPLMRQATGRDVVEVTTWPAGTIGFGWLGGTAILNLPGDPVEAFIACEMFALPVVRRLMGRRRVQPGLRQVACAAPISAHPSRERVVPGVLHQAAGAQVFHPVETRSLITVSDLARAEALAVIPAGVSDLVAGTPVQVMPLGSVAP